MLADEATQFISAVPKAHSCCFCAFARAFHLRPGRSVSLVLYIIHPQIISSLLAKLSFMQGLSSDSLIRSAHLLKTRHCRLVLESSLYLSSQLFRLAPVFQVLRCVISSRVDSVSGIALEVTGQSNILNRLVALLETCLAFVFSSVEGLLNSPFELIDSKVFVSWHRYKLYCPSSED